MKTCCTCHIELDESNFNKNKSRKDGLNSICRICSNARSKRYYQENTEKHKEVIGKRNKIIRKELIRKVNEIKAAGCSFCSEKEVCCMDFHHLSNKEDNIANMLRVGRKFSDIEEEIKKCVLLCANCHRKIHKGLIQIDGPKT